MNTTPSTPPLMIEIGAGELIDKLTILQIKREFIDDPQKRQNIDHEWQALQQARQTHIQPSEALTLLEKQLLAVNTSLWHIEDDIRRCEAQQDFGETFVALARSVYQQNDRRAALKKQINLHCGSHIIEEKSYQEYVDNH